VVAFTMLGRIGLGFILPSLNLGAMRGLDKDLISQGSSAINFVRMLGGSAGVSLCGIVLEWRLAAHGDARCRPVSSAARLAAFNECSSAGRHCACWPSWQRNNARQPPPQQHSNKQRLGRETSAGRVRVEGPLHSDAPCASCSG
jgi:hypothetical protein